MAAKYQNNNFRTHISKLGSALKIRDRPVAEDHQRLNDHESLATESPRHRPQSIQSHPRTMLLGKDNRGPHHTLWFPHNPRRTKRAIGLALNDLTC
jgi:hypothetical protein